MPKSITITLAKAENIKGILEVRKTTWFSTYPNKRYKITKSLLEKMDFTSPKRYAKQKASLKDKDIKTWVAKNGSLVVGYGVARKYKDKDSNYVGSLYILPEYQGQGIGKRIMDKILKWLGNKKPLVLQVAKYNKAAINFYKRFGFIITGPSDSVPLLPDGRKIPSVEMKKF